MNDRLGLFVAFGLCAVAAICVGGLITTDRIANPTPMPAPVEMATGPDAPQVYEAPWYSVTVRIVTIGGRRYVMAYSHGGVAICPETEP